MMLDKLKEIFMDYNSLDLSSFDENTELTSEIGLSSLDYFDFIIRVEDEFDVSISDKEMMSFHTVGDIIRCVISKS